MQERLDSNSGVHAQNGFALQRNMALYILLSDYDSKFKDNDYFICIEHHDDFLFCFLDSHGNCEAADIYQSKKTTTDWTITTLATPALKLLNTGIHVVQDNTLPKKDDFVYKLYFSSNRPIALKCPVSKVKNISPASIKINETNRLAPFKILPKKIQDFINSQLVNKASSHSQFDLEKLHFLYIDLPRADAEQQNQLTGKITTLFGKKVHDPKAAKDTIISLFRNVETVFNQQNKPKLLDPSKQVTSQQIESAINLITTKSKAFDYWRNQQRVVCNTLKIKPENKDFFQYTFEVAFDYFKSLEEQEHKKIFDFVKDNHEKSGKFSEEDIVLDVYNLFLNENNTKFEQLELKAIIYAAYFEITNKRS